MPREVRHERGGPRLFINDQERLPIWGLSISLLETVDNFKGMGMELLQPQMGMASAWTGPGQYDFTHLEEYLGQVLALAPNAYFFPRVQLLTPPWWKEAHPRRPSPMDAPSRPGTGTAGARAPNRARGERDSTTSPTSTTKPGKPPTPRRFGAETPATCSRTRRVHRPSPLASRMMGYFFVPGTTEEWNLPGTTSGPATRPRWNAQQARPHRRAIASMRAWTLRDPAKEDTSFASTAASTRPERQASRTWLETSRKPHRALSSSAPSLAT